MTRSKLLAHLERLRACDEARGWVEATPGTPEELWASCPRGDWLLWMAASAGVDRRAVVLAACDCAETATPYLTDSTRWPALAAIETARRWARGGATDMDVRGASDAAASVAAYAAYAAASYAAYVAAYAAHCAAYAAYAAASAAHSAAYADAAHAARRAPLQRSADIAKVRVPWADVEAALRGGAP